MFFSLEALAATSWKNGGGSTREVLCWPPGAGLDAFDWRVSIATIATTGPFSVFTGIDRTIMLLEGDGVLLTNGTGGAVNHRLTQPFEPFAFSGDLGVDCTLLGGPSIDFNVMSRRGRGVADVHVIAAAEQTPLPPARGGLLMSLAGRWQVGDEMLGAGDGLWWMDAHRLKSVPTPRSIEAENATTARLVAVRWISAAAGD